MSPLGRVTGVGEQPTDRLGRIAAAALNAGARHPEARDTDRMIVMVDDASRGGMTAHGGYDKSEGRDAFLNLLGHIDAMAQAMGLRLDVVPLSNPPGQG